MSVRDEVLKKQKHNLKVDNNNQNDEANWNGSR